MSVLKGRLGDSASVFVNVLYDFPKYLNKKCLLFECLCLIITHGMFYNGNCNPGSWRSLCLNRAKVHPRRLQTSASTLDD